MKMELEFAKIAFKISKRQANQSCPWFLYQRKLPDAVKKLKETSK